MATFLIKLAKRLRLTHTHQWRVYWSDDDICDCGTMRMWPGGQLVTPGRK